MRLGNDSIDQGQVAGRVTSRAEIQVLISSASRPLVQQAVVDDGVRGILDLDRKAF